MTIGSRVRIKLSVLSKVMTPLSHWGKLDGQLGTITNTFSAREDKALMFTVDFDQPVQLGAAPIIRRSFPYYDLEEIR